MGEYLFFAFFVLSTCLWSWNKRHNWIFNKSDYIRCQTKTNDGDTFKHSSN